MNHEFQTVAFVKDPAGITRQIPVTVSYELDGYKPLGLWVYDALDRDITCDMTEAEYDLLYSKACDRTADAIACAIETATEGER